MKKHTIRDIAREAGVSVATVSYVINNKEEQKITPATKKKVLQIINLLNYTPNSYAQTLSNNRNSYIAIHFPYTSNMFQSLDFSFFIENLSQQLIDTKYNLVYLPSDATAPINQVAGILCYNESKESFYAISNSNLTPVIAVDCVIDDPLFYQLSLDFKKLRQEANKYFKNEDSILVCLDFNNDTIKEKIKSVFSNTIYLKTYESLSQLKKKAPPNIILINPSLYDLFNSNNHNIFYHNIHSKEKFNTIITLLEYAIDRIENTEHDVVYF